MKKAINTAISCITVSTILLLGHSMEASTNSYFPSSFTEARQKWEQMAPQLKKISANTEIDVIKIPSQSEPDMFIDYAFIPSEKEMSQLFVLTSGVHGVEAYAGSAVQRMFLDKILPTVDRKNMGVLILHGINPWGFKNNRRVTENNVDLNRNFHINDSIFRADNPGYKKVEKILNPAVPAKLSGLSYYFSFVEMFWNILRYKVKPLRQAVLQGQYHSAKGLFFGGKRFEYQNLEIGRLFKKYSRSVKNIFVVDIHTGFGERGKLHLFGGSNLTRNQRRWMAQLFPNEKIVTGENEDFYTPKGDFTSFLSLLAPEGATFLPITFEFGTIGSDSYLGSIRSINTMIRENQGHHHGYASKEDEKTAKKMMLEMYAPEDPKWREAVIEQSQKALEVSLKEFSKI